MSNFDDFDFSSNPDPRCAVCLILDCSSSMVEQRPGEATSPLIALDSGLDVLLSELRKDPLARRRVELSVVTFGSQVSPATEFATVDNAILPILEPMGLTAMGGAINEALDAIEARKQVYKANGIAYYRPFVLLITDGLPTDDVSTAMARVKEMEARKALSFFPVGVSGADREFLDSFPRGGMMLDGLKFDELFTWLSASQSSISASQPGDRVNLPSPAGWAEI